MYIYISVIQENAKLIVRRKLRTKSNTKTNYHNLINNDIYKY